MASGEAKDLSESEQRRMDEYQDDDMEGAAEGEGEPDHDEWLAAAAAHQAATAGLATAAADPSAVGAALAPPKPSLQPSVSTAMRGMHVAAAGGAAPAAAEALPPAADRSSGADDAAARKNALDDEDTDDDEDDELSPEEQEKADHIANINSVIAAAEAAGFSFGSES